MTTECACKKLVSSIVGCALECGTSAPSLVYQGCRSLQMSCAHPVQCQSRAGQIAELLIFEGFSHRYINDALHSVVGISGPPARQQCCKERSGRQTTQDVADNDPPKVVQ